MPEHLLTYYLRINGNFVQDWTVLDALPLIYQKRYCLSVLKRLESLIGNDERIIANLHLTLRQIELFVHGETSGDGLRVLAEVMSMQDRLAERYDKNASLPNLVCWCCEEALTPALTFPAWNLGALACAAHKRAAENRDISAWGVAGLVQVCTEHMLQRDELQKLTKEKEYHEQD